MIVTDIVPVTKQRYKIYLDNEFAFVLYKGELRIYQIELGEALADEDYEQIIGELLPKRAKLRAMNLLQKRMYTQKALEDKLREGFYSEELIACAIEYVKSFHYIDDVQYAYDYITYHENNKPFAKIQEELMRKGIDKECLMQAKQLWEDNGGQANEEQMVMRLLHKKKYSDDMDYKEKQRIYGYLLRKGYSMETISKGMKNLT